MIVWTLLDLSGKLSVVIGQLECSSYDYNESHLVRSVREAAWITLNRPDNRNALSATLVDELYEHLASADADDHVRAIIITGSGSAFCAGADLKILPGLLATGGRVSRFKTYLLASWIVQNP